MSIPTYDPTLETFKWGDNALAANVSGQWIIAIGKNALRSNTTGSLNYALGDSVLDACTTGGFNGGVGQGALAHLIDGSDNWAYGIEALHFLVHGNSNTAGGQAALRKLEEGNANAAWGEQAGSGLIEGDSDLFLGYAAGSTLQYGDNVICVGPNSQPSATTVSNEATWGNAATEKHRFFGKLNLNGEDQGAFISLAFNAGDFTAGGSMTWTVGSGDVLNYGYSMNHKMMALALSLANTSVGGTLGNELRIAVPAGKTIAKRFDGTVRIVDNGVDQIGAARAVAGNTYISIFKVPLANFSASTDATAVLGQIQFEVD